MQLSDTNLKKDQHTGGRLCRPCYQYLVLFSLIIICVCMYGLFSIDGFSYYPDEFGYWASAAKNVGYDWSEVASLGSYYSFGYSLILTPILYIFKGGVAAYRAAIIVNMLLHCGSLWLLWLIANKIWPRSREMDRVYAVGIAVLYPVWIFYVQMTLSEALITFLYTLICYFFVLLFEKPRVYIAISLVISLVYICCVHLRTIAIVIAAVMVLILWAWKNPAFRKIIIIMAILMVCGIIGMVVYKTIITSSVYKDADAGLIAGNTFAGQIYTIKNLLSPEGVINFLQGCLAKIYYLGIASYGLFYVTIAYAVKRSIRLFKCLFDKEKRINNEDLFAVFILLSMIGQFLITAMYMNSVSGPHEIFYGRYNEYILPIYILIGALIIMKDGKWVKRYLIALIVSIITCAVGSLYAIRLGMTNMHAYFVAGMSYIWEANKFEMPRDLITSLVLGLALMAIVMMCIYAHRINKLGQVLTTLLIAVQIVLGLVLCTKNTYSSSRIDRNDLQVYNYIESHGDETTPIVYLSEKDHTFIDLIQFYLPNRPIHTIRSMDEIQNGCFLIIDADSDYIDQMDSTYENCRNTAWFRLYSVDSEEI